MEFKNWLIEQKSSPWNSIKKSYWPQHGPMSQDPLSRGVNNLIKGITKQLAPKDTHPRNVINRKRQEDQVAIVGLTEPDANEHKMANNAWRDAISRIDRKYPIAIAIRVGLERQRAFKRLPIIDHNWQRAIQLYPDEFANSEKRQTHIPVIFHINKKAMQ